MKRNLTAILIIDELQWNWTVYHGAGRDTAKFAQGTVPATDPATVTTAAEALAAQRDALLAQWREHNIARDGSLRLVIGMPATDALLNIVTLPTRDHEELREMSALQIEKISPFSMDQTCVSCETLSTEEDSSRVLAVGVHCERLEQLGNVFREVGIKPDRVDLTLCARWSSIAAHPIEGMNHDGRIVHLFLHEGGCDGLITQAGVPVLFREMARRETLTDAQYADEIATQTAYSLAACDLEQGSAQSTAVVIVHPAELALAGLSQALQAMGVHDITSRPLEDLPECSAILARRSQDSQSTAFNLAPAAWHLAELDRARRRQLGMTLGAAAALWLAAVGGIYGSLLIERGRLAEAQQQQEALEQPYDRATNIQQRVRNLMQYTDQSRSALEALRDISARQPMGIDLNSYDYRKGNMIRIAGEAENAALVFEFKNALDASPLFAGTDPPSIARSARNDRETFRMTINFPDNPQTPDAQ